jgi:hypothetical protein
MGLIYIFPAEESEIDRITIHPNQSITLKTYGLPMIFWGYLGAILVVIGAMWIGIRGVIQKMLTYEDPTLIFLALLVKWTLLLSPLILLAFYFYEKNITKKENELIITHKLFFMPIFRKKIKISSFLVEHYLDSPNLAKLRSNDESRGFENKGYFQLLALSNDKKIFIDRHSRKIDLIKMSELLSKY